MAQPEGSPLASLLQQQSEAIANLRNKVATRSGSSSAPPPPHQSSSTSEVKALESSIVQELTASRLALEASIERHTKRSGLGGSPAKSNLPQARHPVGSPLSGVAAKSHVTTNIFTAPGSPSPARSLNFSSASINNSTTHATAAAGASQAQDAIAALDGALKDASASTARATARASALAAASSPAHFTSHPPASTFMASTPAAPNAAASPMLRNSPWSLGRSPVAPADQTVSGASSVIAAQRAEINSMSTELATMRDALIRAQAKSATSQSLGISPAEIARLQGDKIALQTALEREQARANAAASSAALADDAVARARAEQENLRADRDTDRKTIAALRQELSSREHDSSAASSQVASLNRELAAARAEVDRTRSDLTVLRAERDSLLTRLTAAEQAAAAASDMTSQLQSVKTAASAATQEAISLEASKWESMLNTQRTNWSQTLSAKESELEALKGELDRIKSVGMQAVEDLNSVRESESQRRSALEEELLHVRAALARERESESKTAASNQAERVRLETTLAAMRESWDKERSAMEASLKAAQAALVSLKAESAKNLESVTSDLKAQLAAARTAAAEADAARIALLGGPVPPSQSQDSVVALHAELRAARERASAAESTADTERRAAALARKDAQAEIESISAASRAELSVLRQRLETLSAEQGASVARAVGEERASATNQVDRVRKEALAEIERVQAAARQEVEAARSNTAREISLMETKHKAALEAALAQAKRESDAALAAAQSEARQARAHAEAVEASAQSRLERELATSSQAIEAVSRRAADDKAALESALNQSRVDGSMAKAALREVRAAAEASQVAADDQITTLRSALDATRASADGLRGSLEHLKSVHDDTVVRAHTELHEREMENIQYAHQVETEVAAIHATIAAHEAVETHESSSLPDTHPVTSSSLVRESDAVLRELLQSRISADATLRASLNAAKSVVSTERSAEIDSSTALAESRARYAAAAAQAELKADKAEGKVTFSTDQPLPPVPDLVPAPRHTPPSGVAGKLQEYDRRVAALEAELGAARAGSMELLSDNTMSPLKPPAGRVAAVHDYLDSIRSSLPKSLTQVGADDHGDVHHEQPLAGQRSSAFSAPAPGADAEPARRRPSTRSQGRASTRTRARGRRTSAAALSVSRSRSKSSPALTAWEHEPTSPPADEPPVGAHPTHTVTGRVERSGRRQRSLEKPVWK